MVKNSLQKSLKFLNVLSMNFTSLEKNKRSLKFKWDILNTKINRIELKRHVVTLNQASDYIRINDVDEEIIAQLLPDKGIVICIALENSYHIELLYETQYFN